ncbi:MAG: hypothetical protein K0S15_2226, partial [Solirubrobacterales bacterium]|nr:hypothetical protein [Solirubrobacterales bacterium]
MTPLRGGSLEAPGLRESAMSQENVDS